MIKRSHLKFTTAFSDKGAFKLLRCLTVLLRLLGGFPYSVVQEGKDGEKGGADNRSSVGPTLGPYQMKPLAMAWSVVMVLFNVGGAVLMFIEKPHSNVFFGQSKLFGVLQKLTMKVEATVSFFMLILLICMSPRLTRVLNILQQASKDVDCLWAPHKDTKFLMLCCVIVVALCSSTLFLLLAYSHLSVLLDLNPYVTILCWLGMICKLATRYIIVILLYSMGNMLASLYSLCSPGLPTAPKMNTILCEYLASEKPIAHVDQEHRCENDEKQHAVNVADESISSHCKTEKGNDRAQWKGGGEAEARATCEKLYRLNECQKAINDYFSWVITLLASHSIFALSEMVFFLSTGQAPIPYMRMIMALMVLDHLAMLGFIFCSPGDVYDQVRHL